MAKVLSSDPGRGISVSALASQPCLIFLCTNTSPPNWRPQEAIRICTGGHGTALKLPQEAGGARSILPQCGSKPVLQRVIPQLSGQQVGKERRLCSLSPVHLRKRHPQSGGYCQSNLHTEEAKETRLDRGRGEPVSPILGCSFDGEGYMLTAQDRELVHKVPREEACLCLRQNGSRPHSCHRGSWHLAPHSLGQM